MDVIDVALRVAAALDRAGIGYFVDGSLASSLQGFDRVEDLEDALPSELYRRDPLPYEAAFLAGKSFLAYRRRGGRRVTPLPDLYTGAHAAVAGHRLLTRDARRYRACFPRLTVIAP